MKMRRAVATAMMTVAAMTSVGYATAAEPVAVPFAIEPMFGSRPVVAATIGGKPYRLVIHANAGSYLQINHAGAAVVRAHDLKHVGSYGITAPGKVSDLGRDDGYVDGLAIGAWSSPTVPVAVFEVPAGSAQGMLGLPFLHDNNAILDFAEHRLIVPGNAPSSSLAGEMAKRGYSPHPMMRDPADGRYLVSATVNGVAAPMVVSTVAQVNVDTAYAARANIAAGDKSDGYAGPSGATGKIHETASPISFRIGRWSSKPAKASIEDVYAYSKTLRPDDATKARGGALGADFMIENLAVIDFGNAVLYLKD